jgi:glycosyltransferase involved in cell wall biosynthesis
MTPRVSIVIPSFNQAQFLEAALQSVFNQDYPALEVIVIDGGSTDGSRALIERCAARLAHWESQPDRGQAHAINKGLQRATGELLGWLNSDDVLAPGAVRRALDVFERHPSVDVVYGRLERIDAQGRPAPTPRLPKDRLTFGKAHVIGESIVNQPGALWRRRAMDRARFPAGPLDERLRYALDYDFWIRLALAGAVFERLPEVAARFRLHPASKTVGQTAAMAEEQLGVLERLLAAPDLPARLGLAPQQVARQANQARARIALHAAYGCWKQRQPAAALRWLGYAVRRDPASVFERRWLDLALARLERRKE